MTDGRGGRGTGLWLAGATACISGVAVFINGNGVAAFGDPTAYTTWKNLVAALLLGAVALVAHRRRPRPSTAGRPPLLGLLAVGVLGGGVPFVLFFEGLARASSSDAAFLHKTLVVWVALLAVPLLGERIGVLHVVAVGVLVTGQAVLRGGSLDIVAGAPETMILAATLLWSVEVVVAKRLLRTVDPLLLGTARLGIGVTLLLVWTAATRGLAPLTGTQLGWVLVTGVVLAAYVGTWYAALSRAPAVDVTAVLVGGSIVTALLAAGVDGAALAGKGLGLGLTACGVAMVAAASRRTPAVTAT